tara:strand:+ start:67 stop:789 length:723 start_codon:yes stop_codon:yes gene_type:complete
MKNRIFSLDNPKAAKAQAFGWLNAIHYMAPHKLAGVGNLCGDASDGCIEICLGAHSGAAIYYPSVIQSRIAKARRFMKERAAYMRDMTSAINAAFRKAQRDGLKLCVRPNGSTDLAWEGLKGGDGLSLVAAFPSIQFTDYTKSFKRALAHAQGKFPANYHLTFSHSEANAAQCMQILAAGGNVAVVFADGLPQTWNGYTVINGDLHDLRHLDPKGVVVGLTPKGPKAKRDQTGFVVRLDV